MKPKLIVPPTNFIKHCGIDPKEDQGLYGQMILDLQTAHKNADRVKITNRGEPRWVASASMFVNGKDRVFHWLECMHYQVMSSFFHFWRGIRDHRLGPALWVSRYFNGEGMILLANGEMRNVRFASKIRGGLDRRQALHHVPRTGVPQ